MFKEKPKDQLDPASYRPICLLPVISKLTERHVQIQLMDYMEETRQLNKSHHTYRKLHRTTTTMLQLTDDLYETANRNRIANIMTIDKSSAFDCVTFNILYDKLKMYNVSDDCIDWFKSYLENRSQYVAIGAKKSSMKSVQQGVPQGSVLGPLMYLIYTNKLPETVKESEICVEEGHNDKEELFGKECRTSGTVIVYVDDATYVAEAKTRRENQEKVTKKLESIYSFLTANLLTVNQSKTSLMEFMVRQKRARQQGSPPSLNVELKDGTEKVIGQSRFCRLLGGNIQEDLTWRGHLEL